MSHPHHHSADHLHGGHTHGGHACGDHEHGAHAGHACGGQEHHGTNESERMNELNKAAFARPEVKNVFESPGMISMTKALIDKVLELVPVSTPERKVSTDVLDGRLSREGKVNGFWKNARVLDFACGPFSVSSHLSEHIKGAVGVDISPDMVDAYNAKAKTAGLGDRFVAYQMDFSDPSKSEASEELGELDACVCMNAFHHIHDTVSVTKRIVDHLKPGAWVVVVEVLKMAGTDFGVHAKGDAHHGIAHSHGLNGDQLIEVFEKAGRLSNVGYETGIKVKTALPSGMWGLKSQDGGPVEQTWEYVVAYGQVDF